MRDAADHVTHSGAAAPAQPAQSQWQAEARSVVAGRAAELSTEIRTRLDELVRLASYKPVAGLTLTPLDVAKLEAFLGSSAPLTSASLVTAIERLTGLNIGEVRVPFTPGQLAELQHRALKRGRTVETEIRAVVARIEEELFYKGG